jgi:hypothetical protein
MKAPGNEKGIALVMVMVLSLIGLAIVAALMFMLTQGTRVSGAHRIFRTAEEAGLGGANLAAEFVNNNVTNATQNLTLADPVLGSKTTDTACLVQKLTLAKVNWSSCTPNEQSYDTNTTPDITMPLLGSSGQTFTVNAKIVDTVPGSSDTTGLVRVGTQSLRGTTDQSNEYRPPANPYLYRIEVQAEDSSQRGVSRYSILYAY